MFSTPMRWRVQLKGEDSYRVNVKRGGKNQTLKYRVVP